MTIHSGALRHTSLGFPALRFTPARLGRFLALYRQRKALSELDTHLLDDIGVSREDAMREATRPAWDVPATWRY